MQTTEFLSAVLPPPGNGYYCCVELTTPRREHKFVESIESLYDAARAFDGDAKDTYFGVATFTEGIGRTAANSKNIRCLFADVDVGDTKTYKSIREAVIGVSEWLTSSRFPVPYMVVSGYGLHCYWPFTEAVPVNKWKLLAEAFKRACASGGLAIDYSVSADAARVLRVPGTSNYKRREAPRAVTIKTQGEAFPFEHYSELLTDWQEKVPVLPEIKQDPDDILDAAPAYASSGASYKTELQDISQGNFSKIVALGADGCLQINSYLAEPTKDGLEPLFRSVISIVKFCIDGEDRAIELGRLHPYSEERVSRKYAGIKGPHNCATFDASNPGVCGGCKHFGKIHNPIALGRELKNVPIEVTKPALQPSVLVEQEGTKTYIDVPRETYTIPPPPDNFGYSSRGVAIMASTPDGLSRPVLVADVVFYAKVTYDRAGERYVQFNFVEHGVEKSTVMPLAVATARDDSIKAFAKIGIMVYSGQDNAFRTYLKATIAEAKKEPVRIMPTNLGWQDDDSFAFNGRMYTTTGDYDVPMHGFDNINETIGTKGTLDGWRLVIAGIMRLQRWDIVTMTAISFGAPLMRFTGLNGLTFHLCGNDSGKGKTLCQRLASSVWGIPDKFRTTPNTSPVAMVNRLGMLGSLPLMVDEITHKGRAEAEWFPEFLSQMSDGRGKDRMESQTNTERRNTTTWATLALMTSNKHMLDYLTAERNHGSEGEVRRLVEIVFDKELNIDPLTKSLLFDTLPENYGVAGEAYARWLAANPEVARQVTKATYTEVFEKFGATGDERFWIAGCACILAGIRLASKHAANVIDIPYGKVAAYLYEVIKHMRLETGRMKRSALDVLNEFTKRNFGKLVTVNDKIARISGIEVAETLDRRDLCGRVERNATDGLVDYYIEEKEIKAFCSSLSYGYAEFKRDLTAEKTLFRSGIHKNLLHGTKGPVMSVKCLHVRQDVAKVVDLFGEKVA